MCAFVLQRRTHLARRIVLCLFVLLLPATLAWASIFGTVQGIVHDPQHRPIQGAHLTLKAQNSAFTRSAQTNANGEFVFTSVPIGNYTVTASVGGFQQMSQDVIVQSRHQPGSPFPAGDCRCERERGGPGCRAGADGQRYTDHDVEPHRYTTNSGRRPHQRHGDDHGLCAGNLHDARHAAHDGGAIRSVG